MLQQVTAGVDGSTESLAAAHWAAREALRRGAALRLVHVWAWHPRPAASVPMGTSEREWAEQTLDRAVGSVRAAHPDLTIAGRSVSGSAVDALLAAAEEAELLVLGSRGLSGVAGFMVGSVSQRVVARSPARWCSSGRVRPPPMNTSRCRTASLRRRSPRPRSAMSSWGWTPGALATN